MAAGTSTGGGAGRAPLILGTAAGLGLLGWFLWTLHWHELIALVGEMDWGWLLLAAALMLVDYALHALRWWVLLRQVSPDVRLGVVTSATMIGTGMNTLLPFRAGVFIRPGLIALRLRLPYPTVLFTTLAEGVCDLFGVVAFTSWMVWYLSASDGPIAELREIGRWAAVGSALVFVGLLLLGTGRARRVVAAALSPLPDAARGRVLRLVDQLHAGLAVIGDPLRLLTGLGITLLIWIAWAGALLATFRALHLDLPISAAVMVEAALSLEMMIPQAPGFVGGFQHVAKLTLTMFGASAAQAEAVALIFWAVCFLPVTLWGVIESWRQGFGLLTTQGEVRSALAEREP